MWEAHSQTSLPPTPWPLEGTFALKVIVMNYEARETPERLISSLKSGQRPAWLHSAEEERGWHRRRRASGSDGPATTDGVGLLSRSGGRGVLVKDFRQVWGQITLAFIDSQCGR